MNKIVEDLLNLKLGCIEEYIRDQRESFTTLTRSLEQCSRMLDSLNQEKRAIKEHLEANK